MVESKEAAARKTAIREEERSGEKRRSLPISSPSSILMPRSSYLSRKATEMETPMVLLLGMLLMLTMMPNPIVRLALLSSALGSKGRFFLFFLWSSLALLFRSILFVALDGEQ
jgi:hypothetical protein